MAKIDERLLDIVVYLYPDEHAAEESAGTGGSGFFVSVESELHAGRHYVYIVTNSHVLREGRSPVLRLTTTAGDKEILCSDPRRWHHHPDGDDLAVLSFVASQRRVRYVPIPSEMLLTAEEVEEKGIGVGDDIFMVGRFVNVEGLQRNTPTANFGNLSMMPVEPVRTPRGTRQESFLVEMRSQPGYSGSPVFVWSPGLVFRPGNDGLAAPRAPQLLGVHWGSVPQYEPVRERSDRGEPVAEGWWVRGPSGMNGVVPAWKLGELLYYDELVEIRRTWDSRHGRWWETSDH